MGTTTKSKIPLILLFGPTGVGKTDLLMELFRGRGEVVSVDSVQVYRGLDIGSAKPDGAYLSELPHHLIDICDYDSPFNAADFVALADQAVRDIHRRGLIPVLSGGTAFYYRNFCYSLPPELPGEDARVRRNLEHQADERGLPVLWERLVRVDPVYAGKIHAHDKLRIIRALEVFDLTRRPLSSFKQDPVLREDYDYCFIGLDRDRDELYRRIDRRVEIMFASGLPGEVSRLVASGARAEHPAMKAIGYREFFEMGLRPCDTLADTADRIRMNSRRYAKRQLTFFRSWSGVSWFHPDDKEGIRSRIGAFLEKGKGCS